MNNKLDISESIYYIFEFSYDALIKSEALITSDNKYIKSDTYTARNFSSYFLFSYYRIGKHLNSEPYKNPFSGSNNYFGESPILKRLIANALSDENIKKTKIYFDNISLILNNRECHNTEALKCLCELMNVKLPEYECEDDSLNDISIALYANQDENEWFNYLKKNVIPINKKYEPIIAEGNVGFKNANLVYKIDSLWDLWLGSLFILFSIKGTIKFCKYCGKPFIRYKQKNILYCSYEGDKCKKEGRKANERKLYAGHEKMYRNIKGKFEYRRKGDKNDTKWANLKFIFFKKFEENKSHPKFDKWLHEIDNSFRIYKNDLFELPDINSL